MTKATFWKPKIPFGSSSTVYLPLASCASVENTFAAVHVALVERLVLEAERELLELGVRQPVHLLHALEALVAGLELRPRADA